VDVSAILLRRRLTEMRACVLAMALAAGILAAARPSVAQAQPDAAAANEAKLHFKNGLALFNEKAYEKAIVEFNESYRLYPFDKVLYNIALCYDNSHAYADALTYYMMYMDKAKKMSTKMMKAISRRIEELSLYVGLLEVRSSEPGAEIILDGKTVGETPVLSLTTEIGEHDLIVRKEGFSPFTQKVTVVSGGTTTVDATLFKEVIPVVEVEKPDKKRKLHPALFYASVGLFGVTALTAVVTGSLALKADRTIGGMYDDEPWGAWRDRRDRYAMTADVMTGMAAVFAAASVTISFFTRFKKVKGKEKEKPQGFLSPAPVRGGLGISWGATF
jgi:hypothetical protein